MDDSQVLDSLDYGDELGYVSPDIAEGETNKKGLGVAKKVAVTGAALTAAAGATVGAVKLIGKMDGVNYPAGGFLDKVNNYQFGDLTNKVFKDGTILGKDSVVGKPISGFFDTIAGKFDANTFGSNLFTTMSNYPVLSAAALTGGTYFLVKGIKKLIDKHKEKKAEAGFSR